MSGTLICGPAAAPAARMVWTAALAFEASSFRPELDPVSPDPVHTMIAQSRAVILAHREIAAVLLSSGLFLAGLLAFFALAA